MSPEDISENFGESHHCKNWKFETENGESRTQQDELQWPLTCVLVKYESLHH